MLIQRIKEKEGITEQLKKDNPMEWVGRMNEIRMRVERMVEDEYRNERSILRKIENSRLYQVE